MAVGPPQPRTIIIIIIMFRMGKFAGAYTIAKVRRDIAIDRVLGNIMGKNLSNLFAFINNKDIKIKNDARLKLLVSTLKERIASTIDNDDDGFQKTDVKILKNIQKMKVFMGIKAMVVTFMDAHNNNTHHHDIMIMMRTMLLLLVADIDKVIARGRRVHLTYRAMRVYTAKKQVREARCQ